MSTLKDIQFLFYSYYMFFAFFSFLASDGFQSQFAIIAKAVLGLYHRIKFTRK
jgi:hypothetical protein